VKRAQIYLREPTARDRANCALDLGRTRRGPDKLVRVLGGRGGVVLINWGAASDRLSWGHGLEDYLAAEH